MATRRRAPPPPPPPNAFSHANHPPAGSVYGGYGDLPTTHGQVPPSPEASLLTESSNSNTAIPNGSSGEKEEKIHGLKKRPSKCRAIFILIMLNLLVLSCYMVYEKSKAVDVASIPQVYAFLSEKGIRVLGDEYVVILSASTSHQAHVRVGKSNATIIDSLRDATKKLPLLHQKDMKWFKIDVVVGIKRLEDFDYSNEFEPNLGDWFGIALDWDLGLVFLPDQVRSHCLVDTDGFLRWERMLQWMAKYFKGRVLTVLPDYSDDATRMDIVDLYHTESMFVDLTYDVPQVVNLYNGHRMYHEDKQLSSLFLRNSAIDAGKYLVRSFNTEQGGDGEMVSYYQPRSHYLEYSEAAILWNGHAASLFAMAKLYGYWTDEKLLQTLKSGIQHLTKRVKKCSAPRGNNEGTQCLTERTDQDEVIAKLKVNSMLLVALVEYTEMAGDQSHLTMCQAIANYILGCYDGSKNKFVELVHAGAFIVDEEFEEPYAQSLATLALAKLYNLMSRLKVNKNLRSEWKDTSYSMAQIMVEKELQASKNNTDALIPDPWLLQATAQIHALHKHTQSMLDYAVQSAQLMSRYQITVKAEPPQRLDMYGSLIDDLSATASAALSHGLCSVYKIVRDSPSSSTDLLETLKLSVKYQLQMQIRPESSMYFRDPQRILGGMHEALDMMDMSNEDSAHNLLSFLCLSDALIDSRTPKRPGKI